MSAETEPGAPAAAPESMDMSSVMEYLRSRGYGKALTALQAEVDATANGAAPAEAAAARDAQLGSQDAVSYTHLTLPTKA